MSLDSKRYESFVEGEHMVPPETTVLIAELKSFLENEGIDLMHEEKEELLGVLKYKILGVSISGNTMRASLFQIPERQPCVCIDTVPRRTRGNPLYSMGSMDFIKGKGQSWQEFNAIVKAILKSDPESLRAIAREIEQLDDGPRIAFGDYEEDI